ncbi:hypothetical protein MMC10_008935 [Thelotrema lepadinum]|nr:hypothetical protein [Thelotrema lepadinum]
MGLFQILSSGNKSRKVSEISGETGWSESLTGRLLRYLAGFDLVKEVEKNTFAPTNKTVAFAESAYKDSVHHFFDTMGPIFQNLPDFLAESRYQDTTESTKTAFNRAYQTDLPSWVWIRNHPDRVKHFSQYMSIQRSGVPEWLSVFPVESYYASWSKAKTDPSSAALLVDVGGGFGHQCVAFRNKYPDLYGRVILQDLPETLTHVPELPNIEKMVHDFWELQPVKGARFYYLRNVLHDFSTPKCISLLQSIIAVMDSESLLLIDEMVIPDAGGVPWQAAQMDLLLMSSFGSLERTREQWEELLEQAGLRTLEVFAYSQSQQESVIVAVPKSRE